MALQHRSDPGGIKKETTDWQRDMAAKGGPATGLGNPENRQVPTPVERDLQTQAAAKSTENKDQSNVPGEGGLNEPSSESQTQSRSGNQAQGSNH